MSQVDYSRTPSVMSEARDTHGRRELRRLTHNDKKGDKNISWRISEGIKNWFTDSL